MEHPDPKTKWKNMRRMAWIGLIHAITLPAYVSDSTTIQYYLMFDAAVVGAYMGFSTWRDGWGKQ